MNNSDDLTLITGPLDGYDYMTFVVVVIGIVAIFYAIIQIGGLPGKIAARRNHPHADTVKLLGWVGLFSALPWIHALIWAFHDSITVDVRKFPELHPDAASDAASGTPAVVSAGAIPPAGAPGGGTGAPQAPQGPTGGPATRA
jgi:hypothetical protein